MQDQNVSGRLSITLDLPALEGWSLQDLQVAIKVIERLLKEQSPAQLKKLLESGRRTSSSPKRPGAELRPIGTPEVAVFRLKEENVVGRSRTCDLSLASAKVSRRHMRVTKHGRGFVVEDLGSANRTWVNGEQIEGPRRLADGDVVSLGDISFEYVTLDRPCEDGPIA